MSDLTIAYPDELPVSAHRAEILDAVRHNPVVIVSGDTGSGKTTQLPKMMLELGRGAKGRRIAVTQPRRLAAVTMAERVANELSTVPRCVSPAAGKSRLGDAAPEAGCGTVLGDAAGEDAPRHEVGGLVGYRHRYAKKISAETRIEFLTDGVLLNETKFDPLLRMYDTIIVDEAHERSLNVDFLLGILRRILDKRRDLKVIVASATMDTLRFAEFFDAPVIDVPGRLFPIDIRYRPPDEEDDLDLPEAIAAAVRELPHEGDILVFLSGERDIREAGEYLEAVFGGRDEIIPLLASLPAAEQRRAFTLSSRRRIVLATNVAETSVTIPGIRYVIDSGLARISRYVHRTQVQRLQIEPISQASARQRAGRCGRLGPGICIRLYSEEDFLTRDAYTAPEVLRSSLAGVILTMLDLKLGDIELFPFIDPPKPAMIREGLKELLELQAITHAPVPPCDKPSYRGASSPAAGNSQLGDAAGETHRGTISLTPIGRKLARIPVEPRLARMLVAANDRGVLARVLPIVAAMSCDDPKRRPIDEKEKAAQAHAKWRVPDSDFLGTLKLWDWWQAETKDLSQSKSRKLAKANYLAWPKLREWCDLTRQLESLCRRLGLGSAACGCVASLGCSGEDAPRYGGLSYRGASSPAAGNRAPSHRQPTADDRQPTTDPTYAAIHISLLTGLLGRIGHYHVEDREYRGAHALRFALHPGSTLAKTSRRATRDNRQPHQPGANQQPATSNQQPSWIVAGELVDTARLFAREAAIIDPAWLEPIAKAIVKHHVHSPMWDGQTGFVRATEQVTLYGLVIVEARRCDYARFNPEGAREIFFRNGLLTGEITHPPLVLRETLNFLRALRDRAEKTRQPEIFDELKLLAHFAAAIPPEITNANALKKWLGRATCEELKRFALKRKDWWPDETVSPRDFPDTIQVGDVKLKLTYRNTPDDPARDGITCTVKKSQAEALRQWNSDWLVPGLLRKKVSYLLLSLPNSIQRLLKPLDDSLTILMDLLLPAAGEDAPRYGSVSYRGASSPAAGNSHHHSSFITHHSSLSRAIREAIASRWGFKLPADIWDKVNLPPYLKVRFVIRDDADGHILYDARELPKPEPPPPPPKPADPNEAIRQAAVRSGEDARLAERDLRTILKETLATVRRLDLLLSTGAYPAETIDDVNEQIAFLTFTDFHLRVPLATLRRYSRYFKGIEIRLQRAKLSPSSDRAKEARFAPYWETYREAARNPKACNPAGLVRYRWLLEEFRLQTFAPELKTFEKVSPKILDDIELYVDL